MVFKAEVENFIDKYVEAITDNDAAFFAGAGFSQAAGYVGWKNLVKKLACELDLDIDKETDFVTLAQFYFNENNNRSYINDIIVREFSKEKDITENHKILARLPVKTIWTTNYDKLIEKALREQGRIVDAKSCIAHLFRQIPRSDCILYKMHGDFENPEETIIIKDDYEGYYKTHKAFLDRLAVDLTSKVFLFVGFSFTDPNIDYIMGRVKAENNRNVKQHYTIMRELKHDDFDSEEAYEYASRRYQLFLKDLNNHGIKTLLVKEFREITEVLSAIERRLNARNVYISGSAAEYGVFTSEEAENFICSLSERLIQENYNIISGFGLGVGSHVISGALKGIYDEGGDVTSEKLLLHPFPKGKKNKELKNKYREDIISQAGVAIFLFGNNKKNGEIRNAKGVRREYEIAHRNGCLIIPVGCTGYAANALWTEMSVNLREYYKMIDDDISNLFDGLNHKCDIGELIEKIIDLINMLKK